MSFSKVFVVMLFGCASGWSYSIKTHSKITQFSIDRYNKCIDLIEPESISKNISDSDRDKIVASNLHEDINIFLKSQNWHFYRVSSELGSGTLNLGVASMELRIKHLEKYTRPESPGNVLGNVGSISHYLQDVTNPAHVVPVYHSTGDGFDSYDFDSVMPGEYDKEKCQQLLQTKIENPNKFLDQVAINTLNAIKEKILIKRNGISETISWDVAFWAEKIIETTGKYSFGNYGSLGNAFGSKEINLNGEIINVDADTYKNFGRKQIQEAIDSSIIIFSYFNSFGFYNRPATEIN